LLSLTINIGSDSGMNAFDLNDDSLVIILPPTGYDRPSNTLTYIRGNSETGDVLDMELNIWDLRQVNTGNLIAIGTYTTTAPEPRSLFLLMPVVALFGLRWRHQRHRT
jgi:hypothetical protein